ncbi:hypothetical protein CLM62_26500 [Streptomyces sp. SA15]|nr:hypothetical protein CLM62_26500 [Streptomyces sp. SA15]
MHQVRADRPRDGGSRTLGDRGVGPVPASAGAPGRAEESLVVGQAFCDVVEVAVAALPVKYRQVVRLVDIDGLSYAEAAGVRGLSEATVTSRLRRARRRIRVRLAAAGLVPGRGER